MMNDELVRITLSAAVPLWAMRLVHVPFAEPKANSPAKVEEW